MSAALEAVLEASLNALSCDIVAVPGGDGFELRVLVRQPLAALVPGFLCVGLGAEPLAPWHPVIAALLKQATAVLDARLSETEPAPAAED